MKIGGTATVESSCTYCMEQQMAMFSYMLGELKTVSHTNTIINHVLTVIGIQHKNSFSETRCNMSLLDKC